MDVWEDRVDPCVGRTCAGRRVPRDKTRRRGHEIVKGIIDVTRGVDVEQRKRRERA